jgi:predicted hotdog family 3-hydroxylacyl-ACP dehydratase
VLIRKAEIRTLVPHTGKMCLLDEVFEWDDSSIVCRTQTHKDPAHPLLRLGQLSAVHTFEYGAQAAALHGGLRARAAGEKAPRCYLAAIRHGRLNVARLDNVAARLDVRAERLFGGHGDTVYKCAITAGGSLLAEARVTIMSGT